MADSGGTCTCQPDVESQLLPAALFFSPRPDIRKLVGIYDIVFLHAQDLPLKPICRKQSWYICHLLFGYESGPAYSAWGKTRASITHPLTRAIASGSTAGLRVGLSRVLKSLKGGGGKIHKMALLKLKPNNQTAYNKISKIHRKQDKNHQATKKPEQPPTKYLIKA